nr:hypothetical protein [Tanacetum cinerariifolium]
MSSDSHATITYTSMSSYDLIVNGYYRMPMDPLDPYVQLVMEAPSSPEYVPGPEAPPSPDYILGPEYPEGDDDTDDDGDDLLEDDADDEDEEESSNNEEEEEKHLALTVPAPSLHRVVAAMAEAKASRVRNGYGSNGSGPRLEQQAVRECTYPNFLKSASQVKYAACTLQGVALTWWNSYVKTANLEVAQELALMCDQMFPEESDRVEKYIGGLPDTIHDSVKAAKP